MGDPTRCGVCAGTVARGSAVSRGEALSPHTATESMATGLLSAQLSITLPLPCSLPLFPFSCLSHSHCFSLFFPPSRHRLSLCLILCHSHSAACCLPPLFFVFFLSLSAPPPPPLSQKRSFPLRLPAFSSLSAVVRPPSPHHPTRNALTFTVCRFPRSLICFTSASFSKSYRGLFFGVLGSCLILARFRSTKQMRCVERDTASPKRKHNK